MAVKEKKSKKKSSNSKQTQTAVPTAGSSKPSSRANLMASFAKRAKPKSKAVAKKDRPILDLPKEVVALFEEFCPTKELFDLIEKRKKRMANEINDAIWTEYLSSFWDKRSQPQNPGLQAIEDGAVDCEGMFIVMAKFRINMPTVGEDEDPADVFADALVAMGLDAENASNFVETELDFNPSWQLDLTSLMSSGEDVCKNAAEKVFLLSQGVEEDEEGNSLIPSADEWSALGEEINKNVSERVELVDKAGFMSRVCNYCDSIDDLDAILTLIKPVAYVKGAKFGVSSSLDDKNNRFMEEAASILSVELGTDEGE